MEKPTFCGMKQRSVKEMHEFKVKVAAFECGSDYGSNLGERDLVAGGFSWPPRSYVCSFCKREFRSAQALGGHMNVHRRDRARLRQSPTRDGGGGNGNCNGNGNNSSSSSNGNGNGNGTQFSVLNLNLEPNPNYYSNPNSSPNYFPPSPPRVSPFLTKFPQLTSKLPPLGAGDAAPFHNRRPATTDFMRFEPLKKGCEGFKNPEFVRLDLEIGLMSRPSKEELDLELRLGYT